MQPYLYKQEAVWFTFDRENLENQAFLLRDVHGKYHPFTFSEMLEYIDDGLKWTIDPYFWQKPLSDPKTWFTNSEPFFDMLDQVDTIFHGELERFRKACRRNGKSIIEPFLVHSHRVISGNCEVREYGDGNQLRWRSIR